MRFARFERQAIGMYVMVALGPIFLICAIGYWVNTEIFLHRAHRVSGQILEMKRDVDNDGSVTFAPVFRFVAENGQVYTVESLNYSSPPAFSVGQVVPVVYVTPEPMSARLEIFWQLRAFETIFAIFSVCFPLGGLFLLWRRRGGAREFRPSSEAEAQISQNVSRGCTWRGRLGAWGRSRWIFAA